MIIKSSSAKLTATYSDIDETFESMHQSIMTKMKTYACKDCSLGCNYKVQY